MKRLSLLLLSLALFCGAHPARFAAEPSFGRTVSTLTCLDSCGFYSMDYLSDYKLGEFVSAGLDSKEKVMMAVAEKLMDFSSGEVDPSSLFPAGAMQAACSAFRAFTPDGKVLYCRNFDFPFPDAASLMIRTSPRGGLSSLGIASMGHVGLTGSAMGVADSDMSLLVASPYCVMDGMNRKGFAISVLALDFKDCARQYNADRPSVMTTVLMRMLLDKCSTVDEALGMMDSVNFFADGLQKGSRVKTNYHFLLADASGKAVVVEYVLEDGPGGKGEWVKSVVDLPYATNFFLSPGWDGLEKKDARFLSISQAFNGDRAVMGEDEAFELLAAVAQNDTRPGRSRTLWSVVYNLTDRTAAVLPAGGSGQVLRFSLKGRRSFTRPQR